EFRWPLNELNVTVPRAESGTCSSMLPLKVSTSMVRLDSHDVSRIVTGPLNVCACTDPETSFRTSGDEKPCRRCEPSTPVTVTGELKTERSSCVWRGTLMSKSVSTTWLPPTKSHHEWSRWFASTTTTFDPDV